MLVPRASQVNRLTIDEGQLATKDGGTDGARDGSEHRQGESLHETPGVVVLAVRHCLKLRPIRKSTDSSLVLKQRKSE